MENLSKASKRRSSNKPQKIRQDVPKPNLPVYSDPNNTGPQASLSSDSPSQIVTTSLLSPSNITTHNVWESNQQPESGDYPRPPRLPKFVGQEGYPSNHHSTQRPQDPNPTSTSQQSGAWDSRRWHEQRVSHPPKLFTQDGYSSDCQTAHNPTRSQSRSTQHQSYTDPNPSFNSGPAHNARLPPPRQTSQFKGVARAKITHGQFTVLTDNPPEEGTNL